MLSPLCQSTPMDCTCCLEVSFAVLFRISGIALLTIDSADCSLFVHAVCSFVRWHSVHCVFARPRLLSSPVEHGIENVRPRDDIASEKARRVHLQCCLPPKQRLLRQWRCWCNCQSLRLICVCLPVGKLSRNSLWPAWHTALLPPILWKEH